MISCWRLCCMRLPHQWVFAVMGCLAITNALTMRTCLSLAITKMVTTTHAPVNGTKSDEICKADASSSSSPSGGGSYEWDEYTQGIILSSFFWGYVITQIPGGIWATKYGGKHVLGLSILSTSIFTILTPLAVQLYEATGLIVLRFLIGLAQGTSFPAVTVLIAQWAPPHERSRMSAVVLTGTQLGTILGTALPGVFIQYFTTGWSMVFYFFGVFGILWFFGWVILCYNSPEVHPFISEEEKKYLREAMSANTPSQSRPTPWWHMFCSAPLWALLVAKFGRDWGFQLMITDLPKYMSSILKFSIQENGFLIALPNVVMWIIGVGSSWVADWSIKSNKLSRTNVRKICTTISSIFPAIFTVAASYAGCDRVIVVVYLTLGLGLMGPFYPGVMVNPIDLSPNHSGTLMAIVNGIGAFAGILAPYSVGLLTPNQLVSEWRIVFWITFGMLVVSNLIFVCWADGNIQYWDNLESRVDEKKKVEGKKEVAPSETYNHINRF